MSISIYWIDAGAGSTQLHSVSSTKIASFSGFGMAPVEHHSQGIPSQHRRLHRGLKFKPRTVQLAVWDHQVNAANQDTRHQTLLTALNPDRGAGYLKVVLHDGTERRLKCRVLEGPDFRSEDRPVWGKHQFYIVRFLALDPFWFNPTQQSESDNFDGVTPVDIAVTNNGQMGAYPTIIFATASENPKVELVSTGEYIEFDSYTVPGGENLTVDLWAGTVKLDAGTDKISELKKASTLFDIPRGAQTLRLTAAAGTTSLCTITWYDRFLGV